MALFREALKPNITGLNLPFAEYLDDVLPQKIELAKADIREEVKGLNLQIEQKVDTFEADFRNELAQADLDIAEAKRVAGDSLEESFRIADEIDDYEIRLNSFQDTLDNVGRTAAQTAGNVLDLFDRVANIFNFIATLGTAARMEYIYADLKAQTEAIRAQIDSLNERLANNEYVDSQQQQAINDLYALLDMNTSQFNALMDAIRALSQYLNPIYNNSFQALYKLDDVSGKLDYIAKLEISTQAKIDSGFAGLPPQMKTALCEALNSGCFDFPECDLSDLFSRLDNLPDYSQSLNEILRRIGYFPNDCQQIDIAHALCGLRGNSSFREILEDFFGGDDDVIDLQPVIDKVESKGNEVIAAIEEIEVSAAVPESWQVRVGADRPQLIVSYAETLTGGKIGRSRYPLTIPHWNGLKKWDLLPKWTKGNTQARLILKDNSRVYIYASSESMAIGTMNKVIKFIDPNMIGNKTPFVGKANISIKPLKVEPCTAKFYAKGQKTEIPDFYQIRIKPKTT